MDRRRFDKLRRGRMEPEARIDLHGMTSEHAHAALNGFILSAYAQDLRLVLVITGKGKADDSPHQPRRHGILRHSLPHWLAAPPLAGRILQVTPAHQRHGGSGAFYVYLRRRR
jgi:DNA-nicking Smr family endonuclease